MNKQKQVYRIMNYCPRPGMFNLLEIFILAGAILVAVVLFRLTSELKETSDLIHRTNFILSLSVGAMLFSISLVSWRNRKIQQGHVNQLETEREHRFQLSATLSTERNKLSTLLAIWPNPVLVLDVHTNIMDASSTAAHLMGVSKPEFLRGRNALDMQEPELANEILEENQRIFKTGEPLIHKEMTILNRTTGKWQQLLITKTPFHDQHGQIAGLIIIGQDVTAQKQTEDALRSANQKLNEGIADLEQKTQGVDLVTEMMDLLSACPSVEEAYKIIENQLGKLNLADSGMLYMIKPSRNNLQQVAAWGQSVSDPLVFPPGDCWGLRRGRLHTVEYDPVTHHDDHDANPLICPHVSLAKPAEYLCLPLIAQGETLGILHLRQAIALESSESEGTCESWFTSQKIRRINSLAESLALALANLMLRSTLRQQSIRDPLTGLHNRRYLEETLERELLRAARSKKNVGLMMLDIDHFKQFNDTYGHPAADAVLSAVSHLFTSSVRGEDLVCRYGGEEFLIMLPETDLESTCQRAEEIREKVAHLHVQYQGQALAPISISIGMGVFPDHAQTPETIINSVDRALYRAKHNGRNRVEVAASTPVEHRSDPRHRWQNTHSRFSHQLESIRS